ncbi:hypothetical protein [Streptomyces mayteni]
MNRHRSGRRRTGSRTILGITATFAVLASTAPTPAQEDEASAKQPPPYALVREPPPAKNCRRLWKFPKRS